MTDAALLPRKMIPHRPDPSAPILPCETKQLIVHGALIAGLTGRDVAAVIKSTSLELVVQGDHLDVAEQLMFEIAAVGATEQDRIGTADAIREFVKDPAHLGSGLYADHAHAINGMISVSDDPARAKRDSMMNYVTGIIFADILTIAAAAAHSGATVQGKVVALPCGDFLDSLDGLMYSALVHQLVEAAERRESPRPVVRRAMRTMDYLRRPSEPNSRRTPRTLQ